MCGERERTRETRSIQLRDRRAAAVAAPTSPRLKTRPSKRTTLLQRTQQEDAVKAHIASSEVAIFSKTYCPYCSRAKALFSDTLKVPAAVLELDAMGAEGAALQEALGAATGGASTVPQVFVGGKLLGGCDGELLDFHP